MADDLSGYGSVVDDLSSYGVIASAPPQVPKRAIPVGEQSVSPAGFAQTMLETGKGFGKAAARDFYFLIGSPGTAYGGGLFGRQSTPASEKITKPLENTNTSQEIGDWAERVATLLPGVETVAPKLATAGTALRGAARAAGSEVSPFISGINPLEHPFKVLPDLVDAAGRVIRSGRKAVEDARLAQILRERYAGPVSAPSAPSLPPEEASPIYTPPEPLPKPPRSRFVGPLKGGETPSSGTRGYPASRAGAPQVSGRGQPLPSSEAPAALSAPPGVDQGVFAQLPPEMQNRIWEQAIKRGAKPPGAPTTPTAPKVSPVGELARPIAATSPEDYTQQALGQIVEKAKGAGADLSHQNAYHVGDVSEHKALNVARHLSDQGVSAQDYATMVKQAQSSGDWSAIDKINDAAYQSGSAGAYPGYLPKSGYSAVSMARRAERSAYPGTSTPERILQHLREYDKLRP